MKNYINRMAILLWMAICAFQAQAQDLNGVWTGQLTIGQQRLSLVFHVDMGQRQVRLDVPEQGAKGIPTSIDHLSPDSIHLQIPTIGLRFHGRLLGDILRGTFSQNGFTQTIDCKRGQQEYKRPQMPSRPLPYTTENVTFQNTQAGVTLSGTLSLPKDYKDGHTPIVLFVTGSGPQNRDEELFYHKPFLVIADALARAGIASLRYDDRGVAQSSGDFKTATTFDFANDAEAGLQFLRNKKAFGKIGIIGHSEGGMIAYMLGSQKKTDFIVSLAGPATRIDTLMCLQLNKLNRVAAPTAPALTSAKQARETLIKLSPDPWTRTFVDIDMSTYIRKVTCPVLHLNGSLDLNVPAELTIPALRKYLPRHKKTLIKEYPGLNHLFQHATTGHPSEYVTIEETTSPEVLNDMISWIKQL